MVALLMVGCASSQPKHSDKYQPMPVEPVWEQFTRAPIVKKEEDNFIVSDEFVKKSVQQKKYIDKVKRWKVVNNIP